MTNEEMKEAADFIAKESPSTLLDALRSNGFWMYAVNTIDVAEALPDKDQDLLPITDADMNYVNYYDRVCDVVNYEDIINEITHQIRCRRVDNSPNQ